VRAIDLRLGSLQGPEDRLRLLPLSITDGRAVHEALEGCDAVFHLASYGMSGGPMLDWPRCTAVNVGGTENVVRACEAHGVKALVHTSTYNVVYGGQRIVGGDETTPAAPLEAHTDAYGPTKAAAERIVLESQSPSLARCVLRPAAIYGPTEERHLPRIAALMRLRLFLFTIGPKDILCDWLHADNFVNAQLLAARALLRDGPAGKASGEAFFISDGLPMNNFEFLRPLCEELGAPFPSLELSKGLMLRVARVCELLYAGLRLPPFLTQAEVLKVGETHYFSVAKAREVLGYQPVVDEGTRSLRHAARCLVQRAEAAPVVVPAWYWWAVISSGLSALYAAVYEPGLVPPVTQLGLLVFRRPAVLKFVWYWAWFMHAAEGAAATLICVSRGYRASRTAGWGLQTFLLGLASMRELLRMPA